MQIAVLAGGSFERRNCLFCSVLSDQGMTQNTDRGRVRTIRFQHFRCKPLGLSELLHTKRQRGLLKRLSVGIA